MSQPRQVGVTSHVGGLLLRGWTPGEEALTVGDVSEANDRNESVVGGLQFG